MIHRQLRGASYDRALRNTTAPASPRQAPDACRLYLCRHRLGKPYSNCPHLCDQLQLQTVLILGDFAVWEAQSKSGPENNVQAYAELAER